MHTLDSYHRRTHNSITTAPQANTPVHSASSASSAAQGQTRPESWLALTPLHQSYTGCGTCRAISVQAPLSAHKRQSASQKEEAENYFAVCMHMQFSMSTCKHYRLKMLLAVASTPLMVATSTPASSFCTSSGSSVGLHVQKQQHERA